MNYDAAIRELSLNLRAALGAGETLLAKKIQLEINLLIAYVTGIKA